MTMLLLHCIVTCFSPIFGQREYYLLAASSAAADSSGSVVVVLVGFWSIFMFSLRLGRA
jgi:hypothetical protein